MKILHITDGIPPATLGGTGAIVTSLAQYQTTLGHEVAILSANSQKEKNDVLHFSVPSLGPGWAWWSTVFSSRQAAFIMNVIRTFAPDLIHMHTVSRRIGYRWMRGAHKAGIPIIATCHDVSHVACGKVTGFETFLALKELRAHRWRWNPLRRHMIRKALQEAVCVIAVSEALKQFLIGKHVRVDAVIRNGIDTTFWKPIHSKTEARTKLELPLDAPLFLLAGRMGFDKGSTLAAATLPKEARLLVAGERFSSEFAPVEDRMHIFPSQNANQMRLLYSAADIVLVPSRCLDCFPTVCLEAMAMERPVMATSWGGAKEAVVNGETGIILNPMNERSWHDTMQKLMVDRVTSEKFAQAGRKHVERHFSLEVMAKNYEEVYENARKQCGGEKK